MDAPTDTARPTRSPPPRSLGPTARALLVLLSEMHANLGDLTVMSPREIREALRCSAESLRYAMRCLSALDLAHKEAGPQGRGWAVRVTAAGRQLGAQLRDDDDTAAIPPKFKRRDRAPRGSDVAAAALSLDAKLLLAFLRLTGPNLGEWTLMSVPPVCGALCFSPTMFWLRVGELQWLGLVDRRGRREVPGWFDGLAVRMTEVGRTVAAEMRDETGDASWAALGERLRDLCKRGVYSTARVQSIISEQFERGAIGPGRFWGAPRKGVAMDRWDHAREAARPLWMPAPPPPVMLCPCCRQQIAAGVTLPAGVSPLREPAGRDAQGRGDRSPTTPARRPAGGHASRDR